MAEHALRRQKGRQGVYSTPPHRTKTHISILRKTVTLTRIHTLSLGTQLSQTITNTSPQLAEAQHTRTPTTTHFSSPAEDQNPHTMLDDPKPDKTASCRAYQLAGGAMHATLSIQAVLHNQFTEEREEIIEKL